MQKCKYSLKSRSVCAVWWAPAGFCALLAQHKTNSRNDTYGRTKRHTSSHTTHPKQEGNGSVSSFSCTFSWHTMKLHHNQHQVKEQDGYIPVKCHSDPRSTRVHVKGSDTWHQHNRLPLQSFLRNKQKLVYLHIFSHPNTLCGLSSNKCVFPSS